MKYEKLLSYTLRLFSKKSYTDFEIKKKCKLYLAKRSGDEVDSGDMSHEVGPGGGYELIDKVIARLIELKYLDDEQYAKDYINDRIRFKPRGLFLIKRELKLKGVPKELTEKIVTEVAIDEVKMATELLSRKRDRWQKRTVRKQQSGDRPFEQFDRLREQKAKAASYLASKGFKPDTVYKAIDHCYNSPESRI